MKWKVNLILILIGLVIIFAIQNAEVVTIRFLIWSFMASRVFVIFGAFVSGMISTWVLVRLTRS
jgi:uncharacterized integral membrane protein